MDGDETRGTGGEAATDIGNTTVEDPKQETQEPNRAAPGGDDDEPSVDLSGGETAREEAARSSDDPIDRLREKYRGTVAKVGKDPYRTIEVFADAIIEQSNRITTLEREAKDGRDFRDSLRNALDESVVRAFGAEKAEEKQAQYRIMADALDVNGVRQLIADLEERASARLGAGGQLTTVAEGEGARTTETPADRKAERRGQTPIALLGI